MSLPEWHNPRDEATSLLPDGYEARVLEPSLPTNLDPQWYADDPTDPSGATQTLVTPIPGEGVTWESMISERPDLADYASDHWLGAYRRLEPLPAGYDTVRRALHQVVFFAIAPKRHLETGKLGLRYTHGGFGTPFFGADEQVRVDGEMIVHQQGDRVRVSVITTLRDAADFLGIPYREAWFDGFHDPVEAVGPDAELQVGVGAAVAIGDWFGFAASVLEEARRAPGADDVSRLQLWPEHFDPAFEMGSYEAGQRASYGASPGDDSHPEPYLYVAAWGDIDRTDPFWNDSTFNGASLSYQELLAANDQRAVALDFMRSGWERLTR